MLSLIHIFPKGVAFKHIKNPQYVAKMKKLIKEGRMVNPVFKRGDLRPVSYTHLDVYKRQICDGTFRCTDYNECQQSYCREVSRGK